MGFVILPRGILGTKRFSNISKKTLSRLARLESLTLRSSPSGDTKIELISPSIKSPVSSKVL